MSASSTPSSTPNRARRRTIIAIGAIALAGLGLYALDSNDTAQTTYRFATLERGRIASTITASGTLRAVVTVDVGSQVSGQIIELAADYNTVVEEGKVIARIDPARFDADVLQAEAELAVARANVSMQKATRRELGAQMDGDRAALSEKEEELKRKKALFQRRVVSESGVEKAVAARDQARARVGAATAKLAKQRAQIEHALAQVKQKEAVLKQRRIELGRTIIRSPVNGVVISRNVDIGQTVAASLQAPILFTIAQDLNHMQVEVSVDEADVGQVRDNQRTTFTVDSFPTRRFLGRVKQVRKAPIEVSNVVTYTVVVSADNPDLRLLPGMTANVEIVVGEREDALKIPNSAFRFRPEGVAAGALASASGATRDPGARRERARRLMARLTEQLGLSQEQQAGVRAIYAETVKKVRAMRREGLSREDLRPIIQQLRVRNRPRIEALLSEEQGEKFRAMVASRSANPIQRGRVWVLGDDGKPKPIEVSYGISDGVASEIVEGDLAAGAKVIVGAIREAPDKRTWRSRLGF